MTPSAPGGGPLPPMHLLAALAVPVVLMALRLTYQGWSGWVPLIGLLALLGTLGVVDPRGRVWGGLARAVERSTGEPAGWLVRTTGWWGAALLGVAAFLAMGAVAP